MQVILLGTPLGFVFIGLQQPHARHRLSAQGHDFRPDIGDCQSYMRADFHHLYWTGASEERRVLLW